MWGRERRRRLFGIGSNVSAPPVGLSGDVVIFVFFVVNLDVSSFETGAVRLGWACCVAPPQGSWGRDGMRD